MDSLTYNNVPFDSIPSSKHIPNNKVFAKIIIDVNEKALNWGHIV